MSKRIYHPIHERLFQHRVDGNYSVFIGSKELSLETNDIEKALKHLAFVDESVSFFGAAAFKKTVGDLFPIFLSQKKKETRARTISEYEKVWKVFQKDGLDKLELAKINQKRWLKFCASKKHSIKDFQNHRNLMHQFLVWCSMHEYIRAVVTLQNPKHLRRKRKVIPPEHMILIFQEAQKSRGAILCYLTFLAFHGPRGVEVRKLPWSAISFENRSAVFASETVKTGEGRQIPLNPIMVEILKIHLLRQQQASLRTKWVFPNGNDPKKHMTDTGFMTAWRTCIRNARLKDCGYTPHDIRATYEKWLEMSSLNETQKQKATGASKEVRLRTYVNLTADDLRGAENVVNVPKLIELLQNQTAALGRPTGGNRDEF